MPPSVYHPRYAALQEHLKFLRTAAGLTQIDLAKSLGTDQSFVSKIERGERYVDVLLYFDWCRACGASPAKAAAQLEKAGV